MSNWIALNPNEIIPTTLLTSFQAGGDAYSQYLELLKASIDEAKAFQSLLAPVTPDIFQTVTKAIVDIVEGFLQAGKIHVLFVPIGKVYPVAINAGLPSTLVDMGEYFGATKEDMAKNADPKAAQAYGAAITDGGGNAGFLQTFTASLMDELDPARPQYLQPNDAVTMLVVLAGSATFSNVVKAAQGLNRVFLPKGNDDLAARTLPIPQGLRAKVIGVPSDNRIGVRLDWDVPPLTFASPYFPGSYTQVKRYAVIRSTNDLVTAATTVLDLFNTTNLTEGLESTDKAKSHKVIAVGSGRTSTWIDNSDLDATKSYYYAVAWELEVADNGVISVLPFNKLSGVVKTRPKATTPSQNAVPPDWHALPSPLGAIPSLAQQTEVLLERLKALSEQPIGAPALLGASLDALTKNLERQIERIDAITQQITLLSVAFSQPLPQLYATSITGIGGNAKLVADLAARLFDTEDPNSPPFTNGEYVTGVCLVAGGPRLPDLTPVTNLLNALFAPSRPTNPLIAVLDDVEATIAAAEAYVFGPDLKPMPRNDDGTVTTPDGNNVDPATIDPTTGLVTPPTRPVIGDDGTPLDPMDPNNPTAGNSNPCSS
jgi:hypothetical protein